MDHPGFTPDHHLGHGQALLRATREQAIEEIIVANSLYSSHRPGQRSTSWRKAKNYQEGRFAVGGQLPTATGSIEALLVGQDQVDGSLSFPGTVEFGLVRSDAPSPLPCAHTISLRW